MIAYIITIIFGIIGFAITTAIRHHKNVGKPMVCPLDSDCNSVVYSSHSKFLGVDVTYLGLFYYGVIVCLYSTYVLFPGIAPDYLYVIGFLMTVTAVIFSVYLLIIQFLVIREWCFWCLLSALTSVILLISSGFALGPNLHALLAEYKTTIVIIHALSAALGMGTVFVTDVFFMKFLKDRNITADESDVLDTLSQVVWFAIAMLILTGIALYIPSSYALLMSTKFLAKVIIVGVIVVNGVLLNLLIAPKLIKISFGHEAVDHPHDLNHLRKLAFAFGAVSIVSWLSTFILGSLRSIPMSTGGILGIYMALVICAVIGSQYFEYRLIHKS